MPKRTADYRAGLLEDLQDPAEATLYLNAALEDSEEMFLVALRDVVEAHRVSRVAQEADISREHVYRMLSASGNPRYNNLVGILRVLGLRLAVEAGANLAPRTSPSSPDTTSLACVNEPATIVGDVPARVESTKSGLFILRGSSDLDISREPVATEYFGWFHMASATA